MNCATLPDGFRWVDDLVNARAHSNEQLQVEFSTESPWNILDLLFQSIVKNGTLDDKDILAWDPYLSPEYPLNAGSFLFSDLEAGEFYEFTSVGFSSGGVSLGTWDGRRISPVIDTPDTGSGGIILGGEQQVFIGSLLASLSFVTVAVFIGKRRGLQVASDDILKAITLALLFSFLVVMPLGSFASSESRPLSWGVSPGDTFDMEVCFRGFTDGQITPSAFEFAQLEGLIITVEILDLGSVDRGILSKSALEAFMEQKKVDLSCESSSPLIEDVLDFFEEYVSAALLPIGDWSAIDNVFDFSGHEYGTRSYYACEVDDIFLFGYHSFYIDAGSGWQANVSLTTGFPEVIQIWSSSFHPPYVSYSYAVALELV
jgi:hypothetical protein